MSRKAWSAGREGRERALKVGWLAGWWKELGGGEERAGWEDCLVGQGRHQEAR